MIDGGKRRGTCGSVCAHALRTDAVTSEAVMRRNGGESMSTQPPAGCGANSAAARKRTNQGARAFTDLHKQLQWLAYVSIPAWTPVLRGAGSHELVRSERACGYPGYGGLSGLKSAGVRLISEAHRAFALNGWQQEQCVNFWFSRRLPAPFDAITAHS